MKLGSVMLALSALILGEAAFAQSVTVNVPFSFVISDRTFLAGQYSLSSTHDKVIVQDADGKTISMMFSNAVSGRQVGATGEVVFHCYAYRCFLSEVWVPTSDIGRQLVSSKAEIEMAKTKTETYFALMGSPPAKK
jgi:hypothetical protein